MNNVSRPLILDPNGNRFVETDPMMPDFGVCRVGILETGWVSTTINSLGYSAPSTQGTINANTLSINTFQSQFKRANYTSAATAGSAAGIRSQNRIFWRGNGTNMGGFKVTIRFGVSTLATGWILFAGICEGVGAMVGNVAPSSIIRTAGVSKDTGDTNFQIISNDDSGTGTKEDTGITPSTSAMYSVTVYAGINGSSIYIKLTDLSTGTFYASTRTTKIPTNAYGLAWQLMMGNNATAAAVGVEFGNAVIVTPEYS